MGVEGGAGVYRAMEGQEYLLAGWREVKVVVTQTRQRLEPKSRC